MNTNNIQEFVDLYDRLLPFPNYLEVMHPDVEVEHERDFKILCPIHEEKTPSFLYSNNMEVWTCFGSCHTTGKTVKFHHMMMKKKYGDQVSIVQAIAHLQSIFSHILPAPEKKNDRKKETATSLQLAVSELNKEIAMIPRNDNINNTILGWFMRT